MTHLFITALLIVTASVFSQNYPAAKKDAQTVSRHGLSYQDDYSWLEKMGSPEVESWVDAQNKVIQSHINTTSAKIFPLATLKKYDDQTNYRIPVKNGAYYYSLVRYSEQEKQTPSLGYKQSVNDKLTELVNPNFFYNSKTVNIIDYTPSRNSKILAYKLMIDGSDQHEVRFVTIAGGKKHKEILKNIKFSDMAWKGDEGIFYKKTSNISQFAADSTFKVFYHKIGTDINNDKLIYDATQENGQIGFFTSGDGSLLFLLTADKDEKSFVTYSADLKNEHFELKKLTSGFKGKRILQGYHNGKMFFTTNEANWGDLRYYTLDNPNVNKLIIPQYQNQLLISSHFYENRIVCKYKNTTGSYLMVFDYTGRLVKKIQTPKAMDVDIRGEDYFAKELFFTVSSYTVPPILFSLQLDTGNYERYVNRNFTKTTAPFPIDYFTSETITYTSRDGVQVPLTIVYKTGTIFNGNNPALLEAYGGFGTITTPSYNNGLVYFLNNGGVYAYAEVRGGGDKGLQWHEDGKNLKKINTVNDFIDAAEYLISKGYTSANRLAITGASQGGLLVAAAMLKRPELFKVAIPEVGVYDMAKFHNYTVGRFHYDEYGNPENKDEFLAMMDYSPYHQVKEDVNYPTTLIITSDNDDRVPPVHSYKFAARLQDRAAQKNPVYLKTIRKSGHYGVTTNMEDSLQDKSDFYSFLLYHLNK